MSYKYQNYTKDTLGVKSNNCIGIFEKNQHLLISENFGEKVDFWLFFRFFFILLWVRNFWETDKLKKKFQKWIQKFTKIILETSSVSISSKLVDIFGLKALCTKAWQKNRTLKRDFNICRKGKYHQALPSKKKEAIWELFFMSS